MKAVVYILLGWTLALTGCYAAGALLLARLGKLWTRQEAVALRFVAGAALYGMSVFFLGIAHLYYRPVFVVLPLLLLAAAWRTGALRLPEERLAELPLFWRRVLWLAAPFTLLYLTNAMAPEASPDGSAYHLGLVAKYYRERGLFPVTTNLYAGLSQGMEMLFLAAFSIGRHSAAAMMHFAYLLALPWLLICYGRRYQMPAAGVGAALLVYLSPVIGIDGISAYNDVAAACVVFALFLVLRRMEDLPGERGLWVLAGVIGGFAFAIKYTLFPALLMAGLWVLWLYRRASWRPLVTIGATASVFVLPWLVRNALWYHNPLAPFFNRWFPNSFVQYWFELDYRRHMAMYSLQSWSEIPWEVTAWGEKLNGILGPVFLLAPLALLAVRSPEGRRLLLAAAFALSTYPSNVGTRFLIPAAPLVAFAMASVIPSRWVLAGILSIHAVLSWPSVIPTYANQWTWRLVKVTWKEALRLRSEENYILSLVGAYGITRKIEELVPPGRRVLGFGQIPEAYTSREYLVGFQSAEGNGLRDIFLTPLDGSRQPTRHVMLAVPKGRYEALRVVQNRDDPGGQWSVAELRVRNGEREVPRSPQWRLRADPTGYDIGKAFDNSYVTRWLTDRGRYSGMYVEVDFGRTEEVDGVLLQLSPDQPWETFHVEAASEGAWRRLPTEVSKKEMTGQRGLRRAAVDELLRRNIHYLAIAESDYGFEDLAINRTIWGMDEIASIADWRLYRLLPKAEYDARRREEN
jgi:hypothetical protein